MGRLIARVANVGVSNTGIGACVMVNSPAASIRMVAWGEVRVVGNDGHSAHVAFVHQ